LSSPRYANPNTRRGYTGVLDRLLAGAWRQPPAGRGQRGGTGRPAGATLEAAGPGDLEPQPRTRGCVAVPVRRQPVASPVLPAGAERRREHLNATRAVPRPAIDPGADSSVLEEQHGRIDGVYSNSQIAMKTGPACCGQRAGREHPQWCLI
jgi:hypothetical protein